MKAQVKQLLIALCVIAAGAAALFSWWQWYNRPRQFFDLFPLSPENISRCEVIIYYEETDPLTGDLTAEETSQLLSQLNLGGYRSQLNNLFPGSDHVTTGTAVTISPSARVTLWGSDSDHVELMLCGDTFVINPLQMDARKSKDYSTVGGAGFQKEVVAFLEDRLIANTK